MPRHVDLFWVPGLCAEWIEEGWLAPLARADAVQAGLQGAFPCVPAALEATLLTGLLPAQHGCLGHEPLAGRPAGPPARLTDWPGVRLHRRLELWTTLRDHGFPSTPARAALQDIGADLAAALDEAGDDHVVLVCGGPTFRTHPRRIDLASLPSIEARAEGGILRAVVPEDERDRVRGVLLRTAGIERVLKGRGLALWGADHPQAGDLVAVAEPGWTFVDEAIAYGSLEGGVATPLLLGAGGQPRWPAEVHDLRVAPTLARYLGRDLTGFADAPLEL